MRRQTRIIRRGWKWMLLPLTALAIWVALPSSYRSRFEPVTHAATFTVTNTNDDGPGSLRNAIVASNQTAGVNVISFNIPGTGVQTITPLSALPDITVSVTIDGLSQHGATNSNPLIELNGANAGANADGLLIKAERCTVLGLVINRFRGSGIHLQRGGTSLIANNRLGTNAAGNARLGNRSGLEIEFSGNNAVRSNLISGNDGQGVLIWMGNFNGEVTQPNVLTANLIGTDAAAAAPLGNFHGIGISDVPKTIIGPEVNVSSEVNIIAGNTQDGIYIDSTDTLVRANMIGTNGVNAIPNGHDGIFISRSANTIGGTVSTTTNVISGNTANGIELFGLSAVGNKITGNQIGLDGTPFLRPLPNGGHGILISTAASDNLIGGQNTVSSSPQNLIAYNQKDGVRVDGGLENKIIGNYIHDNQGTGVFINVVTGGGVGEDATSVLGNRIFNHGGLAIDLAPVGVTPNDVGDTDFGANRLQNFPIVTSASASGGKAIIKGTLNSQPNSTYRLEFFVNNTCDASGSGEAAGFIGFTSVVTDGGGNAGFELLSGNGTDGALVGQVLSATATDAAGNTSELSPCVPVQDAGLFSFTRFVTTVNESAGSVTVSVGRSGNRSGVATVDFATRNGSAQAGADYTATNGTLHFADGDAEKSFSVAINNDSLAEGVELFQVDLSNPTGVPTLGLGTTQVNIDDDEVPSGNVYVLTTGNELLRFNTAQAGPTPLSSVQINGEKILAIDFRPATGQLYGLGLSGHLFSIDKNTGALTTIGSSAISGLPEFTGFGFDFNPVTDRARVALFDRRNLQLNPDTGDISADSTLAFASGDPNAGVTPIIFGLANSNNFAGASATTTYALQWTDAFFPTKLVTLGSLNGSPVSPNSGQLFTIGSTGAATADTAGFDISDTGEAFATMLHPDGLNGAILYKIDLLTGAATRIGFVDSANRSARDIAIEPRQHLQFSAALYSVNENGSAATITVKRSGGSSGPLALDYASSDGTATAGQDYVTSGGTLNFADGETSRTFVVPLIDDSSTEGVERVNLTLSNATNGAVIGPQSTAAIAIMDEATEAGTNPIDNAEFFVRQHYADFLSRQPDTSGLTFWTNHITQCFNDASCVNQRRVGTSAAFFIENEFQQGGFFIFRLYRAALNRRPSFIEFTADRVKVVGGANLENSRQAFALEFVQRQDFLAQYPSGQDASTFVDALIATASQASGITDLSNRRDALMAQFNLGANESDRRARALRALIDDAAFSASQYNSAFVLMQYFGFLQRGPDQAGYDFWLNHLNNSNPNNYRAMVCAFITSAEYQRRFGQLVTRSDHDCSP